MSAERPPLPPTEPELEDLMRIHLEAVTPSIDLRQRTQAAIQARATEGPGRPWWALALVSFGLGILGLWAAAGPGDDPQVGTPPAPAQEAAAPTPVEDPVESSPTPVESQAETPAPSATPEPDMLLKLAPAQASFEADYDYNQLHELFAADVVVAGRVESVTPEGGGTLRVSHVLRGQRSALLEVSTAGDFTGCEGVPDFRPLEGVEVCLFLRRLPEGGLQLLHGSAGLQRLPYHGKLSLDALAALLERGPVPGPELVSLVEEHGARILTWLGRQLRGADYGVASPELQAELLESLEGLAALPVAEIPRPDVIGIVRALRPEPEEVAPSTWAALQAHHDTFRANPLGAWVQQGADSYRNDAHDHAAFLAFLLPHDAAWVAAELRTTLDEIRAGMHPHVKEDVYAPLRARLEALGLSPGD